MRGSRRPICALAALLFLQVAAISPSLRSDRTWFDEDAVLLDAHGIAATKPWPALFYRDDVVPAFSLARVLSVCANHDAYPPLWPLMIAIVTRLGSPILTARATAAALVLLTVILLYSYARRIVRPWVAVVAAGVLALHPAVIAAAQQIKWMAPAMLFSTAASLMLADILGRARPGAWRWAGYVVACTASLHTHYFCAWLLPAHGLHVLLWRRRHFKGLALSFVAVALLASPWYLWGLPQQSVYLQDYYATFEQRPNDSYKPPVGVWFWVKAVVYDVESIGGFQPGPIRSRFLLPLAAIVVVGWVRAWRSENPRLADLARLATIPALVGLAGQTAFGLRLGHFTPLSSHYFAPWVPLLFATAMLGLLDASRRMIAWICVAVLGCMVPANSIQAPVPSPLRDAHSLSHYRLLARSLSARSGHGVGIVHGSDTQAKLANLFYEGCLPQAIGMRGVNRLPPAIRRIMVVTPATGEPWVPSGWARGDVAPQVVGTSRIEALTRR